MRQLGISDVRLSYNPHFRTLQFITPLIRFSYAEFGLPYTPDEQIFRAIAQWRCVSAKPTLSVRANRTRASAVRGRLLTA